MNTEFNNTEEKKTPEETIKKADDLEMMDVQEEEYEVPERVDYEEEIIKVIRSNESPAIKKEILNDYHENDIAAVLEELDSKERRKLYSILGLDKVSEVFAYLDDPEEFIEELDEELAADILENMEPDEFGS